TSFTALTPCQSIDSVPSMSASTIPSAAAAEPASGARDSVRPAPLGGANFAPLRAEVAVTDCPIEGNLPADLSGGFYATGPDPQYPLARGNIPFDGEGHVRMFRISNGRVNYRSRYARTERYVAQDKARRVLM